MFPKADPGELVGQVSCLLALLFLDPYFVAIRGKSKKPTIYQQSSRLAILPGAHWFWVIRITQSKY
ncbi:hypothetical protein OnM2_092007 [Erysiphe neolycopersici]|uniref:Uncharacterized protein n=1 Tax=Erysiphe neolycopersici TaxID=212602 RepID=A0A420HCF5_9PEZI|nr:hypothetical protein OnM2_092007 [Erysiphe neolycopersici]